MRPEDEVLVNYEDIPLMFYPPNRIRGGNGCFRMDEAPPARFAVLRRSALFVHGYYYGQFMGRHQWRQLPLRNAPDIPW